MDKNIVYDNDDLIKNINKNLRLFTKKQVNIVNDKLTLSVFELLRDNIKRVSEINFVVRSPIYNGNKEISREFEIEKDVNNILFNSYDIIQKNKLTHLSSARKMYDFIKDNVNVKKVKNLNTIKSNLLTVGNNYAVLGDSSLEVVRKKEQSFNFNTEFTNSEQVKQIKEKFEMLWNTPQYTENFKEELLENLKFVYKDYSPEFLYYFTLFSIFEDSLNDEDLEKFENDKIKFKESVIWNKLYKFQKDAVVSAINKIEKYNGCIIADSVGLGKTFEALAIIKYYEMKNLKVLVLTPKKLYENWSTYKNDYIDNPIAADKLHYDILFHSDLSRKRGKTIEGKDLERLNLENYELLVIDESHNFRNRDARKTHETRYNKLINDIIKKGYKTKVLLLSATPVNNTLIDLKNQLSIITVDDDRAFIDEGISSISQLLRKSQMVINDWAREENKDKQELLDRLPSDFFKLLEMITIARSRKHIVTYYGTDEVGTFPEKKEPLTIRNKIDKKDELVTFREMNDFLDMLNLSIYSPMKYILPEFKQEYRERFSLDVKEGSSTFYQEDREESVKKLYKFNILKRMESSIEALNLTLQRLKEQIVNRKKLLEDSIGKKGEIKKIHDYIDNVDLDDDDEFEIEQTVKDINIEHLDKTTYIYDLNKDLELINPILDEINTLLKEKRDEKLEKLQELIINKITNTPYNQENRKILIFSAFSDTVKYLYKELGPKLKREYNITSALITGSEEPKTTNKKIRNEFNNVLGHFSPISKEIQIESDEQIDILFATDCISEGQNLQDCDTVINFDIHWNPVRLIQRFGRIDRIGSKNRFIKMINFFPDMELNEYLNLERRVKGKMIITNMTGAGDDDQLSPDMNDFNFRKRQLETIQREVVDLEETRNSISLTDLNLNDYKYDIKEYLKTNPVIRKIPKGIYSITSNEERKGVIFCFRKNEQIVVKAKEESSIDPYYLVYITNSGEIYFDVKKVRDVLNEYRKICYGKKDINYNLINKFNNETKEATDMKKYSELLTKAINYINGDLKEKNMHSLFSFDGLIKDNEENTSEDFELISMLIVD